jgi:hypothetical protein
MRRNEEGLVGEALCWMGLGEMHFGATAAIMNDVLIYELFLMRVGHQRAL